jgi:dipeptidyl aminopeptidase/acylaminoacyl peptidase
MKKTFTLLLFLYAGCAFAQKLEKLTVEKIMRDPQWMGTSPSNISWSEDSKKIYFTWNPENKGRDALYEITPTNLKPEKVSIDEKQAMLPGNGSWNKKHTIKVYEKNGDIYFYDAKTGVSTQLTSTTDRESSPAFNGDETRILFIRSENLYAIKLNGGELIQLTNFTRAAAAPASAVLPAGLSAGGAGRRGGAAPVTGTGNRGAAANANPQDAYLKAEQLELFDIIKKKAKDAELDAAERKLIPQPKTLKAIAIDDKQISNVQLSPDGRYITYRLITQPPVPGRVGNVPDYVTASGFTEDIPNRTKVGTPQSTSESYIFDTQRDSVYAISKKIPGIKDLPDYVKDYPDQLADRTAKNQDRKLNISGINWSNDGKNAVVILTAQDYKDRWIMKADLETGILLLLDRQHDDAWIGGPGINSFGGGSTGWVDNTHFYYQSEATGYSHIYVVDVESGDKKQLTSGKFEVSNLRLSNDKKDFYFTANMEHPGITHFYRISVTGGTPIKLTTMKGGNEVELSPDEKWLAIRYSYSNKPWELYLQPNKPGAKPVQVTTSATAEFNSYPWREPEMITFKNRYGTDIYARVYPAKNPDPNKPAVVFVHGAGYLQNVHYWWSSYFREYMFNNLLADNGYTVLDIDYTGSAGYGRNIRTGIYRHMGGKDLTDQVDGVKYLTEHYGVNPAHVGLYGGSYGGFITLMALFTTPDVFAAGAGLRSVTDWANYNHGYTANILNEPFNDPKAYKQSSPIYFADGLKGRLLMCHGMVDDNVNFQDIVKLSQKLIELHKHNWELAVYPVESHGFIEPSSWTDEYSRILKLFDETLKGTK